MRPYQAPARTFALTTALIAAGAALPALLDLQGVTPFQWGALLVLSVLAGVSFLYPVPAAREGAAYDLANVFIFAGLLVLPPALVALLCTASVIPLAMRDRHRPGVTLRSLFNAAQTLLAALLAQHIMLQGGVRWLWNLTEIGWTLAGILSFVAVQTIMVDVFLALNRGLPLRQVLDLDLNILLSEAVLPVAGVGLVVVWRSAPWLLALALVPVLLMHRVLRNAQQIRLAQMDTKTGLFNYRHFRRLMDEELQRSRGVKRPLAVLFADLDLLREVNNRHGHLAGDRVIRAFADVLQSQCRPGDVAARFGGEEFIVLLPGTDQEEAAYMAEQIRVATAQRRVEVQPGVTLRCTVSMGVAAFPDDAAEAEQLIQRADDAALRAKELGRNRVEVVRGGYAAAAVTGARAELRPAPGGAPEGSTARCDARNDGAAAAGPPSVAPARSRQGTAPAGGVRWAAVLVGAVTVVAGFWLLGGGSDRYLLLAVLAGAAMMADGFTMVLYMAGRTPISVSLGQVVMMAGVVLAGPAGALVTALASSIMHLVLTRQRSPWKIATNVSVPVLAGLAAGYAYPLLAGSAAINFRTLIAAGGASAVNFAINSLLVCVFWAIRHKRPAWQLWTEQYSSLAPHLVLLGMTGSFCGLAYQSFGAAGAAMFLVPLLVLQHSFGGWARRTQIAVAALEQARDTMAEAHDLQRQTMEQLIEAVAAMLDARDYQTSDHSRQVAEYAVALARELDVPQDYINRIRIAALLHDLGKVGIPEAILHKPDRLTPDEYDLIKEHAAVGERILSQVAALEDVARMIGEHHETWDGGGYPRGLAGDEISLGGRIIAVADALDSMTSDRPYSRAKSLDWALAEFRRCAGFQFDPTVVEALERVALKRGPGYFVNRGLPVQSPVPVRAKGLPVLAASREHAS